MPVRLLTSAVLRWPDAKAVHAAVLAWTREAVAAHPEVQRIGYFGSYARGDWGVGSDLDVVIVVDASVIPFERRGISWDFSALPVPTDVVVYTAREWEGLRGSARFGGSVAAATVWVYRRPC